jgi:ParB/RepB/Spo0J family partition protein
MKSTKSKVVIKKQSPKTGKNNRAPATKKDTLYEPYFEKAETKEIDTDLIDFSPYNRRKFFNQEALQELAENIIIHGIIQDIGVRPKADGRYELIFGQRRLMAARIAGCEIIKAKCASIPDKVVKEIMFSENAHRQNQHPMDEAFSIGSMLEDYKTSEEIAHRLGKSKTFVAVRAKLLSLIEPLQELFFFDKINISQALLIATLSEDSQKDLFTNHCEGWKDQADFGIDNIHYILRYYRYDLNNAPFDISDITLLENVGPCNNCHFNTAMLTTLFPQEAPEAICTKKICYEAKCSAHFITRLNNAFVEIQPQAMVLPPNLNDFVKAAIEEIDSIKSLPRWDRHSISIVHPPVAPTKEEYTIQEDDTCFFDEDGYNLALQEQEQNIADFNRMMADGTVLKGLLITNTEISGYYFSKGTIRLVNEKYKVTAYQVKEAIAAGKETPELLQGEIERVRKLEERSKELDAEHIQATTHKQFETYISTLSNTRELTTSDSVSARLLIYQSLTYANKEKAEAALGLGRNFTDIQLLDALKKLNDIRYAYLIRMAMAGKSDSKIPTTVTGICLMELAESAGVDVEKIKEIQNGIATKRAETVNRKLQSLTDKIEDLSRKAA